MELKNNEIRINRGDEGIIPFKIPLDKEKTKYYQFKVGDVVTFGVYDKKGFDKCAHILKEVEITEPTEVCYIELTSEDTTIGELINKEVEYWYEISLNNETVLGYKKDTKARLFWLLPEGSGKKC